MQKQLSQDHSQTLQTAIEDLEVFTQLEASRLEVGENGRLVAAKESRLERVVSLARCYIGPLFFEQIRQEQEQRLLEVKKAVLRARDIVKSLSPLIEKFKEGNESQRRLAESAVLAIQRYNAIVAQDISYPMKSEVHNYERERLLSDQEIKGQQIELPFVVSVKYDSHPDAHPAHKMLKELSQTLRVGVQKNQQALSPTHKKSLQFMIDTFQMKAIRMIEMHLQKPVAEIVPLVKRTIPEVDEESSADFIHMQQFIEVEIGSIILVTGCFKRETSSKLMAMPILDSFRLSFQLTHTGYPYASQHTGWVVGDKWVEASPLRVNQTPHFHQVNQRRKHVAHQLLFDQAFIQKMRRHFKLKREVFDQNRPIFLSLHRQMQQALQRQISQEENHPLIEAFYQEVACAPSAFDLLVQTQQQMIHAFIQQPFQALEEEWLEATVTPLRTGSPQERFQVASSKLEQHRHHMLGQFNPTYPRHAYLLQQGLLLGKAFQTIALQYQSEKMGFCPPLLSEFERKLQISAFQQLLTFLDECEHRIDVVDPAQIKSDLLVAWSKDLQLIESHGEEGHSLAVKIVDEIERYFDWRFHLDRGATKG